MNRTVRRLFSIPRDRSLAGAAHKRCIRRGFNLVEMLIALAITSALLTATMVALRASFTAYQMTTEEASTHTIARLSLHRMLTMIRTGDEFGPFPADPKETIVESNFIEFRVGDDILSLEWIEDDQALYLNQFDSDGTQLASHVLLDGVTQDNGEGGTIVPFTLEYELGNKLHRATIDLSIAANDNLDLDLEGDDMRPLRIVATAMPRTAMYDE